MAENNMQTVFSEILFQEGHVFVQYNYVQIMILLKTENVNYIQKKTMDTMINYNLHYTL